MEGSAIWLAGNDTGIVEPMVPGLWRKYIMGKPENPLTLRTYDAYGWYALLDHLGRPMWSLVARPGAPRRGRSTPAIGGVHRRSSTATPRTCRRHGRRSTRANPHGMIRGSRMGLGFRRTFGRRGPR